MKKVLLVKALQDYQLEVKFLTGEIKFFSMKPYLEKGVFTQLKDINLFNKAFISANTVCWPNDLDISPDTLFLKSYILETYKPAPCA